MGRFEFGLIRVCVMFVMFVWYQKPKFPVLCDAEDPCRASPKPPADPLEVKRGLAGARARLLRAGSLTTLPPVEGHTDGKEGKEYRCQSGLN